MKGIAWKCRACPDEKKVEKLKLSEFGLDLIKRFEGLRLQAYQCSAGVWTIGYGHTRGVRHGDIIDEAQAAIFLRWVSASGKCLPGLVRRRAAEKEIFMRGYVSE